MARLSKGPRYRAHRIIIDNRRSMITLGLILTSNGNNVVITSKQAKNMSPWGLSIDFGDFWTCLIPNRDKKIVEKLNITPRLAINSCNAWIKSKFKWIPSLQLITQVVCQIKARLHNHCNLAVIVISVRPIALRPYLSISLLILYSNKTNLFTLFLYYRINTCQYAKKMLKNAISGIWKIDKMIKEGKIQRYSKIL